MLFSIIIPLYNKANSIASSLQSILNQNTADYEVIIVNDGSTDSGELVVKKWIQDNANENWSIVNKQNGGVSSARNIGIKKARGKFAAFLDADDIWHPEYLLHLTQLIDKYPQAAIIGTNYKQITTKETDDIRSIQTKDDSFLLSDKWNDRVSYFTSATAIRCEVFERIGYFDERITHGEDIDMWWRVMLEYPAAYDNNTLSFYIQDSENRAMDKAIPLETHLPFFIQKYAEYRSKNIYFRRHCDKECLLRLFPYAGKKEHSKTLKKLLKEFDFDEQKKTMKLRFVFPRSYRLYKTLKAYLFNHG